MMFVNNRACYKCKLIGYELRVRLYYLHIYYYKRRKRENTLNNSVYGVNIKTDNRHIILLIKKDKYKGFESENMLLYEIKLCLIFDQHKASSVETQLSII